MPKRWAKGLKIDIAVSLALTALAFALFVEIEAFESLYAFTRAHEDYELDEWILLLPGFAIAAVWFAVRRLWAERRMLREAKASARALEDANLRLTEAKAAVQRADDAKTEFLSVLGHELRSPFNAIMPMTELLQASELTERQARSVDGIQQGARDLLGIIDGMVEFSRLSNGMVERACSDHDIVANISAVVERHRMAAEGKGLSIALRAPNAPCFFTTDADALDRLLDRLIRNAIRFTDAGGVTITLDVGRDDPADVTVSVADTGPGLSDEQAAHIFEPFWRGDHSEARKASGGGLGLAIARALAAHLGGGLSLSRPEGGGACFTFAAAFPKAGAA